MPATDQYPQPFDEPPVTALAEDPRHRRLPVVADANALLEDMVHRARRGRSLLTVLAAQDLIALLTAEHIAGEVTDHLPRVAADTGLPPGDLQALWLTEYAPRLRLVRLPPVAGPVDPRVAAVTDPEDVPVAQLAVLVAPCLLLTRDRHLHRAGLGEARWADALGLVRQLVALDQQLYAGAQSAQLLTSLAIVAIGELAKAISRSPIAQGVLLGAAFMLATDWRPAAGALLQRARGRLGPATSTGIERLGDVFQERAAAAAGVEAVLVQPQDAPSLPVHLARLLAQRGETLPAPALATLLERRGVDASEPALRAALREHPAVELVPGRGWRLGHLAIAS